MVVHTLKQFKAGQLVELDGKKYVVLSSVDLKFFKVGKGFETRLEKVYV